MKNTNDKQEEMTLKGWLYFGLFFPFCCLIIIPIFYVLGQILFILCCWLIDYIQLF